MKCKGLTHKAIQCYALIGALLWIIGVGISLGWNIYNLEQQTIELSKMEALASIQRDLAARHWVSAQGGVYVPKSAAVEPNPYLKTPKRDIVLDELELTLVNPAYYTRLLMEQPELDSNARSRIVNIDPLRPENRADEWETQALESFKRGIPVAFQVVRDNGAILLRGIKPFTVQPSCMSCHSEPSFTVGGQGGGISIVVDMEPYLLLQRANANKLVASHAILALVGLLGMYLMYRHSSKGIRLTEQAIEALRQSEEQLEQRVAQEMAQRRKNEEMLVHQSRMAAMGKMIGAIGHQWKQPLNVLAILVQDMPEAYDHGEVNRQYLEESTHRAMEQIDFMSATIDDFRVFFDPNKERGEFSIRNAIDKALKLLSAQLEHHNIQVCIRAQQDYKVIGHKNEFQQVILNLLVNARDAIYEQRIQKPEQRIAGEILIELGAVAGSVEIRVCDNGCGVDPAIAAKIFEPYFSTKEEEGSGIGLWMARSIMEQTMCGSIRLEPQETGSCFIIAVPISSAET